MKAILAIDGGGTRTRCTLFSSEGAALASSESGASNHLLVDPETVRSSIAEASGAPLQSAGLCAADVFVSAGLAGIDFDGRGAAEMRLIFAALGFGEMLLNGDMVIAHAGALDGGPGILALSGTGSAVLAIDQGGRRAKVGGWGPLFGDEGSAFRVAERALRAAACAVDGRGPATSLAPRIMAFWGLANFRDTVERVYVGRMEPRGIAALAPVVAASAADGDQVAASILTECGAEIAKGVLAAMRRVEFDRFPVAVSWQGSLLELCAPVRAALAEMLSAQQPALTLAPPLYPPITGAFRLAEQAMLDKARCT
jgi:glucosamine kinase